MKTSIRVHEAGRRESQGSVHLWPEIAERMVLEGRDDAAVVGSFFFSRGAQRAWEAINQHLRHGKSALFWIGGPGGSGKTHFLNYTVALSNQAGAISAENARFLTLALESGPDGGSDIARRLLELVARQLAGGARTAALWSRMDGAEALPLALDHARRQGIKAITAALDFGDGPADPDQVATLTRIAGATKNPRLTIIAAGRDDACGGALFFNIAPDRDEEVLAAIGRARRLSEEGARTADAVYRTIDIGEFDPRQIFPFHPRTLEALAAVDGGVARIAQAARAAVERWLAEPHRLIYPSDLMELTIARRMLEMRLGESGRAALAIAYAAAETITHPGSAAAREIVDALMLRSLAGGAPLGIDDLLSASPAASGQSASVHQILKELNVRSRGVIGFNGSAATASFEPMAAGAPEVASFNAALELIRRFDPAIEAAVDARELRARIRRLNDAMAEAIEAAFRNRETLAAAIREAGGELSPEREQTFADFRVLTEAGAKALIETGADESRRAAAMRSIADYEALAALAAAVPRLRAMREYLRATGLRSPVEETLSRDRRVVALEMECALLLVSANPASLREASRAFDALEARFQKFKWSYARYYRAAHDRWRGEMERVAAIASDLRRYLDALRRLDSIAALGPPQSGGLTAELAAIEGRAPRCDFDGPLSPEITPRCPRCDYVLGAEAPQESLGDIFMRAKRALKAKLAVLAGGTIRRLIRQYDRSQHLEGFLKITQAAQIDAIIHVLDDELIRYLMRLIDENKAVLNTTNGQREFVRALQPEMAKGGALARRRRGSSPEYDSGGD